MRNAWNLLMVGTAVAVLLMSVGCGSKNEAGPETKTAAISGGGTNAARSDASTPLQGKEAKKAPADPLHPVLEIQTNFGNIVVELDKTQAPITVDNFLRYVESGHYDKTIFHQVLKDYVIMGGAYTESLAEKKAHPPISNEAQRSTLKNSAGTIAMVRKPDAPHSATCQFFINVADNPNLDFKGQNPEEFGYCTFGKVTSGMDVVRKIAEVDVADKTVDVPGKADKAEFERLPKQTVAIQSLRRLR